jgi:hypothetical protein
MMGMNENKKRFTLAIGTIVKRKATKPMRKEGSSSDGATNTMHGSTTLPLLFKD